MFSTVDKDLNGFGILQNIRSHKAGHLITIGVSHPVKQVSRSTSMHPKQLSLEKIQPIRIIVASILRHKMVMESLMTDSLKYNIKNPECVSIRDLFLITTLDITFWLLKKTATLQNFQIFRSQVSTMLSDNLEEIKCN